MRRLPQNLSLLAVSVFTVGAIAVAPVSARQGADDTAAAPTTTSTNTTVKTETETSSHSGTGSTSTSTTSGSASGTSGHKSSTTAEVEHTAVSEAKVKVATDDLKDKAQKLLAAEREAHKTKSTLEVRQKACENHKTELATRSQNYTRNAQKHLDTFNGIYAKVLAFQEKKQLKLDNYSTLKAAADAKKVAAETAVAALDGGTVNVDCTATDPATGVAALKTTVSAARQALQEYRTAVKNLVVALQTAKDASASSSTSSATSTEAHQ